MGNSYHVLIFLVAFWISVLLVLLIVVLNLVDFFLKLHKLLRFSVSFKLRPQFSKFLVFYFAQLGRQFTQTNHCLNNMLVPVQFIVVLQHQAFECEQSEFTQRVQVIVVLVPDHVLDVSNRVSVLFEGLSVVTVFELVLATYLFKPNALIVVDCRLVSAVFKEKRDDLLTFVDLA